MKLLDFVILKLTLCFIVGILIGYFITIPSLIVLYLCFGLLISLLVCLLVSRTKLEKTIWFGSMTFLTMMCIGILVVNFHDQRHFKNHYSKVISTKNDISQLITFKVREALKPTAYHNKYVVDILKLDQQSVSGKLLLNVQKDSIHTPLKDKLLIQLITYVLEQGHFNPKEINDDFSENVFKDYLDQLDPFNHYFYEYDIK